MGVDLKRGALINIILTYDPRWEYSPQGHPPVWASLDTVDYVTELLEECGCSAIPLKADPMFESKLREILNKYPRSLVFWLNEFMPIDPGKEIFTVKVIEEVGLRHTGPSSDALAIGLDKEATKNVFRKLGLPTPESIVVNPGQDSYLSKLSHWNIDVLIKPLLQGNSRGIDEYSIVEAADTESIKFKVKQIHKLFNEPALIEAYIGGSGARELSIPLLLSFDGGVGELPIVEIDLLKIPSVQGKYRYLTREIKAKGRYQKNQVELSQETRDYLYAEVARIINEIGCKDMTRVDLRSDSTGLYFIEVNVNPCKTKFNSSLITSAYSLGLKYEELIAFIPYQAMMKYGIDPPTKLEELVEPVNKLIEQSNVGEYSHTQFVDQQI